MTTAGRLGRSAALVLGTGYVFCFFSETLFWSMWRPDEDAFGRIPQWLFYSLLAYMTLAVIRIFRIDDAWSVLLAGAFFGWMGEGIVAMTVYGDPSMPFPVTIAWTALAWHAPLSVLIGWYGLGLALRHRSAWRAVLLCLGLGLFWGVWGYCWMAETPPVVAGGDMFVIHAVLTTGLLTIAHVAVAAGRPAEFAPSRIGLALAGAAALAFFALVTVPNVPIAVLVLPALLGLLFVALRRHRAARPEGSVLDALAAPIRRRNLLAMPLMPVAATAVYVPATEQLGASAAVQASMAVATILGGTAAFTVALTRALRRRA